MRHAQPSLLCKCTQPGLHQLHQLQGERYPITPDSWVKQGDPFSALKKHLVPNFSSKNKTKQKNNYVIYSYFFFLANFLKRLDFFCPTLHSPVQSQILSIYRNICSQAEQPTYMQSPSSLMRSIPIWILLYFHDCYATRVS